MTIQEMQRTVTLFHKVDDMESGRRSAIEGELPGPDGKIPGVRMNAIRDESKSSIAYPAC